ncbi:dTMP kinase [Candidatus Woesearchaeota archaeon CG10_big_fil_rev_8_21_14_0_10_30_7]|nr:MAG: dTMP kinase [Candidatus Woesearchaeota archaeon CG10_big_fil_rev_8_21_14_0_10_30_7]
MIVYNKFIVLEGIDGCGKGTQLKKITSYLYDLSKKNTVLVTRNPYSSPKFEAEYENIRGLLKTMKNPIEQAQTLSNLFIEGNRFPFSKQIIEYNMSHGHFIVCDRYDLSTKAYQGGLQGLDINELIQRHEGLIMPGLTFLFDIPAEVSLERTGKSQIHSEVFDSMQLEQTEKLRQAYLSLINKLPERKIIVIDAVKSPDEVFGEVKKHLNEHLKI